MNIENNKFLFYVCAGLTASGNDGYDHSDADISVLAREIHFANFSDDIKAWFARARTGQVEVNPYWPRGSALAAACFFMDDNYTFDISHFLSFIKRAGISDPVGKKDFKNWVIDLPDILRSIEYNHAIEELWAEYCDIVNARSLKWQRNIKIAVDSVKRFFLNKYGENMFELSFAPNLFAPHSADFVRVRNRIIVIASSPDAETILHEAMHVALTKYREKFTAHAEEYGLGAFADTGKMLELGYMEDESTASVARAIEECFARALSVILSGGKDEHLQVHSDSGFDSVPFLGWNIRRLKISYVNLGEFIDKALNKIR